MFKRNLILGVLAMGIAVFGFTPPDSLAASEWDTYHKLAKQYPALYPQIRSNSKLGTALPIWKITQKSVNAYNTSKQSADLLSAPDAVLYPVLNNDSTILFIRINQQPSGTWQNGGIGLAQLAKEYLIVQSEWSSTNGNAIVLVENEITRAYLFSLNNLESENLTPFKFQNDAGVESTAAAVDLKYQTLDVPASEVTRTLELTGGL